MDSNSQTTVASVPKEKPKSDLVRFAVVAGGVALLAGGLFWWLANDRQPEAKTTLSPEEKAAIRLCVEMEAKGLRRRCPECREPINCSATRCPHCTAKIGLMSAPVNPVTFEDGKLVPVDVDDIAEPKAKRNDGLTF